MLQKKGIIMASKHPHTPTFVALTSMWVAITLACAFYPVYYVLGTSAMITLSSIVFSGLTAPLLGPFWGSLAGLLFGLTVPFVNSQVSIGVLTFLTPTLGAVMSSLVLFNRWKEATAIFALEMVIWFSHPFAWYQDMWIVTWQYWVALVFIIVPPIRKWIASSVVNRNPANLTVALWCLAWTARMGDVATGNNIAVWINGWGTPSMYLYWVPATAYYAVADSLTCLGAALIGTAVLLALKRANIRIIAIDSLHPEKKD